MTETARDRFLREQAEYEDALTAYRIVLQRVSSGVPLPYSMQSNYSSESRGWERAATDPWIQERFPELQQAAERVRAEEEDFMALDDPNPSFANPNCSLATYTAEKFYEYAAMAMMVHRLATDPDFRHQILSQISEAFQNSAVSNAVASTIYSQAATNQAMAGAVLDLLGLDGSRQLEAAEESLQTAAELSETASAQMASYFQQKWDELAAVWGQCGLGTAIARTAIDGVFMLAEIGITAGAGAAALRGLRLSYRLLPDGIHRIDVLDTARSNSLGDLKFSRAELEEVFGKPEETHVGGLLPDPGRGPTAPGRGRDGVNQDPLPYRHPRDGDPPRSRDELLPNGRVPGKGQFADWWDDLSSQELESLLSNRQTARDIGNRIRNGGGEHEWLKVSQQLEHKRLGFSMKEIQEWVTATDKAEGPLPQGGRWRHNPESGSGAGPGSGTMHNALDELYGPPPARNRNDLLRRMGYFANSYLDGGIDGLPAGLRDAILTAGGG